MAYKCVQCGGQVEYVPNSILLRCIHCSSEEKLKISTENIHLHTLKPEENTYTDISFNVVKCNYCGAEIIQSNTAIDKCPYCTNVIVNENYKSKTGYSFDGIIAFKISKNEALQKIKKWKTKLYLTPNDFKKQIQNLTFLKGVYIPYWIIQTKTNVTYKGKCGQKSFTSSKMHWASTQGKLTTRLENIALLATNSIPESIKDKTMPDFGEVIAEPWDNRWNFNEMLPYNEAFVYGFLSEIPQYNIHKILNKQEKKIKYELEQKVIQKIEKSGCSEGLVEKLSYEHIELQYRLALLPAWIGAYRYKNRIYQILVNGQTGETVGERPISKFKVVIMWFLILVLMIYIGFIIALENYWLWALHIVIIGIAIYLKKDTK